MTYAEKLKDPRWQRKRLEIMQRDNFTCCECCSTHKTLNVHHRFYLRGFAPWEYSGDWLQTLCEDCHGVREEAIEKLHQAFLFATTGDLIVWAKRVRRAELAPQKAIEKQSRLNAKKIPPPARGSDERMESLIELGRAAFAKMRQEVDHPLEATNAK